MKKLLNTFSSLIEKVSEIEIKIDQSMINETKLLPLVSHYKKYQYITWRDLYKFIYQGTAGWTHLLNRSSVQTIQCRLEKEIEKATKPEAYDELFELLDIETNVGRINIRIWKAQFGTSTEVLWKLMLKVEKTIPKTTKMFIKRWAEIEEWIDSSIFIIEKGNQKTILEWVCTIQNIAQMVERSSELPLVSHSERFRRNYQPSYRLVNKDDLKKILESEESIK